MTKIPPNLRLSDASTLPGVLVLGALTLRQLSASKTCTFMLNSSNEIELAHPAEIGLDLLPEEQALQILMQQLNYTDSQLVSYLKAREYRLSPPRGQEDTNAQDL